MKRVFQHALLPLTAVLLIAGIFLLVVLYNRQNNNQQSIMLHAAQEQQTLQAVDMLNQARHAFFWSTRRYMLSGDTTLRAAVASSRRSQDEALARLNQIAAGMGVDKERLKLLNSAMYRRSRLIDSLLMLHDSLGRDAALQLWATSRTQEIFEGVDRQSDNLKIHIYSSLAQRSHAYITAQQKTEVLRMGTLALLLATLVVLLYLVYRHRRNTAALRERMAHNMVLLQHMKNAVVITSQRYRVQKWNAAFEQLVHDKGTLTGKELHTLLPALLAGKKPAADAALERKDNWTEEVEYQAPDKSTRILKASATQLRGSDGSAAGIFWLFEDVTLEKTRLNQLTRRAQKLELCLNRQVNLLQRFWNEVPEGMFQLDLEGRYRHINKRGEEFLPYAASEVIGRKMTDVFPNLKGSNLEQVFRRVCRTQIEERIEFRSMYSNRTYDVSFIPTDNLVNVVFRDVSKLKKAQDDVHDLYQALHEARAAERRRIFRELHDELGQQLTANKVLLSFLATSLKQDDALLQNGFRQLEQQMQQAIESIRYLSREFHPMQVEDLGLFDALRQDAAAFTGETKIILNLHDHTGGVNPEPRISVELYHIVAEILSNIRRHALAKSVGITLDREANDLVLTVVDDGAGFNKGTGSRTHTGIAAMNERAKMIGAVLQLHSRPGEGTCITIRLPLPQLAVSGRIPEPVA